MIRSSRFERRCRELGEEIFERARAARPRVWQRAWWQEQATRVMQLDEALKVQLFRFIDVLPALRSDAEIIRHLREYLDPRRLDLPRPLRFALDFENGAERRRLPLRGVVAAKLARRAALAMARRFITGSTAEQAIRTIVAMRGRKLAFTLDLLGEATTSDVEAERNQQIYLDLLDALCPAAQQWAEIPQIDRTHCGSQPRVNLSVKFSALDARLTGVEPLRFVANVSARMRPILRRARQLGAFINVDMESYRWRDLTLEVFKQLLSEPEFRDWPHVGIVVQAYLRDGEADLRGLLEWVRARGTPIAIRLVKGAYWDYETALALQKGTTTPVWTDKWESDASFEKLAMILLESAPLVRPAFASHNVRSLASAMATGEELNLTPGDYEVQMLYGMADPLMAAVAEMGRCVRVYAPYGDLIPGMAYLIRRLLENTSNDSFLRQSFSARVEQDRLLADPAIARPLSAPPPQRFYQDTEEDSPMIEFTHAPETDFSQPANREKMFGALKYVRGEFGREYPLLVAGEPLCTREHAESVNPALPTQVIGRVSLAEADHVRQAVTIAQKAWPDWRRTDVARRCQILRRAAQMIEDRHLELAATLVLEGGRPWSRADQELARSIDLISYYTAYLEALDALPRRRDLPGESNRFIYAGRGVFGLHAPHDFSFAQAAGAIAGALVAGNVVIFSPGALRGVTAFKLIALLSEAGLPAGTIACLPSAPTVLHNGLLGEVRFSQLASGDPRGLGTNDIIVDDDADPDQALPGVVQSAFELAGQHVGRCTHVIAVGHVYETFCKRLVEATRGLVVGPAEDPATVLVGPLANLAARDYARDSIERARRHARVLFEMGPERLPTDGYFVRPIVLGDVPPARAPSENFIFGPILPVIRAADFETALEISNGPGPALTVGVYSRSPAHIELARRELRASNIFINRKITGARVDVQPLGPDWIGGPDALRYYIEPRCITENTLRHGLATLDEPQMAAR